MGYRLALWTNAFPTYLYYISVLRRRMFFLPMCCIVRHRPRHVVRHARPQRQHRTQTHHGTHRKGQIGHDHLPVRTMKHEHHHPLVDYHLLAVQRHSGHLPGHGILHHGAMSHKHRNIVVGKPVKLTNDMHGEYSKSLITDNVKHLG